MAESDNILTKLQDLLVYLIPQLNKFPRDQKFVLGDRIETKLLDVQEFCLRAYYSRDKRGHLLEANLQLEVARHLVRLANALKLFSNHTFLGQRVWPGRRRLCRENVADARRRLRWNVNQYKSRHLSKDALLCRWNSWRGHTEQADCGALVEKVKQELRNALGATGT